MEDEISDDIDLDAIYEAKIEALQLLLKALYLMHFGKLDDPAGKARNLMGLFTPHFDDLRSAASAPERREHLGRVEKEMTIFLEAVAEQFSKPQRH